MILNWRPRIRIFTLLGIFACWVLSVVLLVLGLHQRQMAKESLNWPSVTGEVMQSTWQTSRNSEGERYQELLFSYYYEVDGERHESKRISWDEEYDEKVEQREFVPQRYPRGAEVEVFYDPDKPSRSVLEVGNAPSLSTILLLSFAFLTIFPAIVFFFGWWEQRKAVRELRRKPRMGLLRGPFVSLRWNWKNCLCLGVGLILSLGSVALGIILILSGYEGRALIKESADWPSTQGKIIHSAMEHERFDDRQAQKARIGYEYQVAGQVWQSEGRQLRVNGPTSPPLDEQNLAGEALVEFYPVGKEVEVFYNPNNPEQSYLVRSQLPPLWITWLVGAILVLLIPAVILFSAVVMAAKIRA